VVAFVGSAGVRVVVVLSSAKDEMTPQFPGKPALNFTEPPRDFSLALGQPLQYARGFVQAAVSFHEHDNVPNKQGVQAG
jgi:hypothetical protein